MVPHQLDAQLAPLAIHVLGATDRVGRVAVLHPVNHAHQHVALRVDAGEGRTLVADEVGARAAAAVAYCFGRASVPAFLPVPFRVKRQKEEEMGRDGTGVEEMLTQSGDFEETIELIELGRGFAHGPGDEVVVEAAVVRGDETVLQAVVGHLFRNQPSPLRGRGRCEAYAISRLPARKRTNHRSKSRYRTDSDRWPLSHR